MRSSLLAIACCAPSVAAQVVGFDVTDRSIAAEGRSFADVGTYERFVGRVRFALDPHAPANQRIVDLGLAPTNDAGRVEADCDVVVLQPVEPAKRRGTALIEVSNRGGLGSLALFDRGGWNTEQSAAFGDGLLMRLGLTVVFVGWQQDVPRSPDRLRLRGPVLHAPDGGALEGPVRADWVVDRAVTRLGLGHREHVPFPAVDPESDRHVLTRRSGRESAREPVARDTWRFSADGLAIEGAFDAGWIYELVYQGRDPLVTGLGFAAVRDIASWLENDPDCPCHVDRTIAVGVSQTARFLRHMLWEGFATDTAGRATLDGVLGFVGGGGRGSFNHRFAQPSRDAHGYSAFFFPTDLFPFSSTPQEDPVTRRFDGLFARTLEPDHLPRTFWINGGYEYWSRNAGAIHTSVDGTRDVEPTDRERIYHIASAQHGEGDLRSNPLETKSVARALLVAMLAWIEHDTPPPASRFPHLADHSLVAPQDVEAPRIPGVTWPKVPHVAYRVDYGPRFLREGIVDVEPPRLGPAFPTLVPQVDAFGNELGGIRTVELQVPVGSFLPWTLRPGGADAPLADFVGHFVPLAKARATAGDARPSLAELYPTDEAFARAVQDAARALVAERFLLDEDVAFVAAHARRLLDAVRAQ